jgi:hypothetical protein
VTAAIIIAAHNATGWILDCLEAWEAVRRPEGWQVGVRVGVDGCEATSALLRAHGIPHYTSPRNGGPYVVRNSLIALQHADAYVIFDADDLPHADYLTELLPMTADGAIAGSARRSTDMAGTETSACYPYANGVAVIPHAAWDIVGGYRSWRMAADHDLIGRARAMGVTVRTHPAPLYTRRTHPDSLTRATATHLHSVERRKLKVHSHRTIQRLRGRPHLLRVEPQTVKLAQYPAPLDLPTLEDFPPKGDRWATPEEIRRIFGP